MHYHQIVNHTQPHSVNSACCSSAMNDDAEIRRANLRRLNLTPTDLSTRILNADGEPTKKSYWSDLMRGPGKSFGEKTARNIEEKLGLPRLWLDADHTPLNEGGDTRPNPDVLEGALVGLPLPCTLSWESLMRDSEIHAAEFRTHAPDDSMAPRLRAGQVVTFDRTLIARPGDGVLVRDKTGAMHIRQYRQAPGRWEAQATNEAYATLDSERDGLQVVAVLTAVQARWG